VGYAIRAGEEKSTPPSNIAELSQIFTKAKRPLGIDAGFMGQGYTFDVTISGNVRINLVKRIQNRCG
jgi:hypothetical protein